MGAHVCTDAPFVVYSYEKTLRIPVPDVHRNAALDAVIAANWTNEIAMAGAKRALEATCPQSVIVDVYSDGTRRIRGAL